MWWATDSSVTFEQTAEEARQMNIWRRIFCAKQTAHLGILVVFVKQQEYQCVQFLQLSHCGFIEAQRVFQQLYDRKYLHSIKMLFYEVIVLFCFKVVTATGTLALGINMPCKSVVFAQNSVYLDALNYRQVFQNA